MMFQTDPSTQPLFETAAENLLNHFGAQALGVAGAAIEKMQASGSQASFELIDLLTISPIDGDTIAESVKKTGRCMVVQEAPRSFGVASEIIAIINDKALMYLEAPVKRLTGFDVVMPYMGREELYMPSEARIIGAIEETLNFQN